MAGKLDATWEQLITTLRWRLGFHRDALYASLTTLYQGKGESLERVVGPFKAMWMESGADEATATRFFIWNMSEDGRATFAARLERKLGAPRDPEHMEEQLSEVPLAEMFQLASGGEWLSWVGSSAAKRREARAVVVNRL